jgi:hypothetical protein
MLGGLLGLGSAVVASLVVGVVLLRRRGLWRAVGGAGVTLGTGVVASFGVFVAGIYAFMAGLF